MKLLSLKVGYLDSSAAKVLEALVIGVIEGDVWRRLRVPIRFAVEDEFADILWEELYTKE